MATATAPLNTFVKFRQFAKLEDGKEKDDKPTVWGISTWEEPDSDNEQCDYETAVPVYQAWSSKALKRTKHAGQDPSLGNVRIQHGSEVGGKVTKIEFNDKDKEIWLGSEPISDDIKNQLKQGFYTGYSQGGSYAWRACSVCEGQMPLQQGYNFCETCGKNVPVRYGLKRIAEVSYVDSPATGEGFEHVKANGSTEILKFQKHKENTVAKTKTVAGVKLPASSFAHVGDENETSTWKLPIEFPGDEKKTKCLVGSTPIPLLNGRTVPIAEVKENDWVYSFDVDRRTIAPGRVVAQQLSGSQVPIVRVTLDNGTSVECTPNHPFLLLNAQYRMAGELLPGDSIMPLYLSECKMWKGKGKRVQKNHYERVFQPWYGVWEFTHRLVNREATNTPLFPGNVVHHLDHNHRNNEPSNLGQMTKSGHMAMHASDCEWWGGQGTEQRKEAAQARWDRPGASIRQSDVMKAENERRAKLGIRYQVTEIPNIEEHFQRYSAGESQSKIARELGVSGHTLNRRFKEAGLLPEALNPKVIAVEDVGFADV